MLKKAESKNKSDSGKKANVTSIVSYDEPHNFLFQNKLFCLLMQEPSMLSYIEA